jgi:LmbE family N-acetylglucosaminyl deacetylase
MFFKELIKTHISMEGKMKAKGIFFVGSIILTIILFFVSLSTAKILVISPHPDDDVITVAGITYRAVQNQEPVEIIYMTNGDFQGIDSGYLRQGEAVNAQAYLGMIEDNLIFLGYPDGYLETIYYNYVNVTDIYSTTYGQSATYGNRGLGRTDYHLYRFGSHANYNRYNILLDLEDIISSFKPEHIFTLSQFDTHPDHSTTYELTRLAVLAVNNNDPNYNPTIHKTIIWWHDSDLWPNSMDPTAYFAEIPDLFSWTGLNWNDRESIEVPLAMQSTNYWMNPKYLAVSAHASQENGVNGFLGRFIHRDEIFWVENLDPGTQYSLTVNVSPSGAGSVSKNPNKSTYLEGEQVTLTATANTGYAFSNWTGDASGIQNPVVITMNGNKTVEADFAAIPGNLSVTPSDGLSASGTQGGPFSPSSKTYTLQNTGGTAINWSVSNTQGWVSLSSSGGSLTAGASTTVAVSINGGANSLGAGSYSDTVSFINTTNGNGSTFRSVALTVQTSSYGNIAPLAVVTASSENPAYGQLAIKAVDGVIDGYPGDYTKEWATSGGRAGSWLQLNWSVPYTVDTVILYDRPNLNDNIQSATLSFSDGSTLTVGPLNNAGAGVEYTFPPKVITSLRMTVNTVSGGTQNIGLAEMKVYGN